SSRRRHTRFSRDWSSDVCSSDLVVRGRSFDQHHPPAGAGGRICLRRGWFLPVFVFFERVALEIPRRKWLHTGQRPRRLPHSAGEIGRASCRERAWVTVEGVSPEE